MNTINIYEVVFEPFAQTHFIKKFARKYKGAKNLSLLMFYSKKASQKQSWILRK